jgi:hypothetical protein
MITAPPKDLGGAVTVLQPDQPPVQKRQFLLLISLYTTKENKTKLKNETSR